MEKGSVSKATLGRLPSYLQHLKSTLKSEEYISATAIAKSLSLGEVQVRKDLNAVSGEGRPKIGYSVDDLIKSIEKALRYDDTTKAVIVGAGMLGQALLNYEGFKSYGVEIAAAFDLIEKPKNNFHREVRSMKDFDMFCRENDIKIGIITVNEMSAQDVCEQMMKNNIGAIWNFTPAKLEVPDNVLVKQENLALSVAYLNNQLVNKN